MLSPRCIGIKGLLGLASRSPALRPVSRRGGCGLIESLGQREAAPGPQRLNFTESFLSLLSFPSFLVFSLFLSLPPLLLSQY